MRVALKSNDTEHVRNEIGDLLFTCVNISRFLGYNAEDLLRINIKKFEKWFEFVDKKIKEKKIDFSDLTIKELDTYWNEAKKADL